VLKFLGWRGYELADGFEHSPENVKRSVENSLKILDGKKSIDIFEPARVDKNVPLEVTLKDLKLALLRLRRPSRSRKLWLSRWNFHCGLWIF
jgi:aryl-alcohol dehydrogenase-like predicted oxidoreductase